jgi:hypothetical protein
LWLGRVILIGAWASRIDRLHYRAHSSGCEPPGKLDADVAVSSNLLATGKGLRNRRLKKECNEQGMDNSRTLVHHCCVVAANSSSCPEFVTPLKGSELQHGRKRTRPVRITEISVHELRDLEVHPEDSREVMIAIPNGYPPANVIRVCVPNAAAFMVQRIPCADKRKRLETANSVPVGRLRQDWANRNFDLGTRKSDHNCRLSLGERRGIQEHSKVRRSLRQLCCTRVRKRSLGEVIFSNTQSLARRREGRMSGTVSDSWPDQMVYQADRLLVKHQDYVVAYEPREPDELLLVDATCPTMQGE